MWAVDRLLHIFSIWDKYNWQGREGMGKYNTMERENRPGGGGVLGISSDGDDQMEPKVKTQNNP